MIIPCQNAHCGFNINLSDDKIPDKPMKVPCPRCKYPNPILPLNKSVGSKRGEQSQNTGTSANNGSSLKSEIINIIEEKLTMLRHEIRDELGSAPASTEKDELQEEKPQEMLAGAGSDKALICDDNTLIRTQIKDSLSELGFKSEEAKTVEEAIVMIKNASATDQHYTMMLIDKVFPGDDEGGYKILNEIASLPLHIRRRCFVAFVSAQLRTNDASTAFLMGANTVINKKDLPKLQMILKEETAQYENLYKVFNICLES